MPFAGVSESTGAVVGRVATHLAPIEGVQQHANNQGDSNHDDHDARDASDEIATELAQACADRDEISPSIADFIADHPSK